MSRPDNKAINELMESPQVKDVIEDAAQKQYKDECETFQKAHPDLYKKPFLVIDSKDMNYESEKLYRETMHPNLKNAQFVMLQQITKSGWSARMVSYDQKNPASKTRDFPVDPKTTTVFHLLMQIILYTPELQTLSAVNDIINPDQKHSQKSIVDRLKSAFSKSDVDKKSPKVDESLFNVIRNRFVINVLKKGFIGIKNNSEYSTALDALSRDMMPHVRNLSANYRLQTSFKESDIIAGLKDIEKKKEPEIIKKLYKEFSTNPLFDDILLETFGNVTGQVDGLAVDLIYPTTSPKSEDAKNQNLCITKDGIVMIIKRMGINYLNQMNDFPDFGPSIPSVRQVLRKEISDYLESGEIDTGSLLNKYPKLITFIKSKREEVKREESKEVKKEEKKEEAKKAQKEESKLEKFDRLFEETAKSGDAKKIIEQESKQDYEVQRQDLIAKNLYDKKKSFPIIFCARAGQIVKKVIQNEQEFRRSQPSVESDNLKYTILVNDSMDANHSLSARSQGVHWQVNLVSYDNLLGRAEQRLIKTSATDEACGIYAILQIIMANPHLQELPKVKQYLTSPDKKDPQQEQSKIFDQIQYLFVQNVLIAEFLPANPSPASKLAYQFKLSKLPHELREFLGNMIMISLDPITGMNYDTFKQKFSAEATPKQIEGLYKEFFKDFTTYRPHMEKAVDNLPAKDIRDWAEMVENLEDGKEKKEAEGKVGASRYQLDTDNITKIFNNLQIGWIYHNQFPDLEASKESGPQKFKHKLFSSVVSQKEVWVERPELSASVKKLSELYAGCKERADDEFKQIFSDRENYSKVLQGLFKIESLPIISEGEITFAVDNVTKKNQLMESLESLRHIVETRSDGNQISIIPNYRFNLESLNSCFSEELNKRSNALNTRLVNNSKYIKTPALSQLTQTYQADLKKLRNVSDIDGLAKLMDLISSSEQEMNRIQAEENKKTGKEKPIKDDEDKEKDKDKNKEFYKLLGSGLLSLPLGVEIAYGTIEDLEMQVVAMAQYEMKQEEERDKKKKEEKERKERKYNNSTPQLTEDVIQGIKEEYKRQVLLLNKFKEELEEKKKKERDEEKNKEKDHYDTLIGLMENNDTERTALEMINVNEDQIINQYYIGLISKVLELDKPKFLETILNKLIQEEINIGNLTVPLFIDVISRLTSTADPDSNPYLNSAIILSRISGVEINKSLEASGYQDEFKDQIKLISELSEEREKEEQERKEREAKEKERQENEEKEKQEIERQKRDKQRMLTRTKSWVEEEDRILKMVIAGMEEEGKKRKDREEKEKKEREEQEERREKEKKEREERTRQRKEEEARKLKMLEEKLEREEKEKKDYEEKDRAIPRPNAETTKLIKETIEADDLEKLKSICEEQKFGGIKSLIWHYEKRDPDPDNNLLVCAINRDSFKIVDCLMDEGARTPNNILSYPIIFNNDKMLEFLIEKIKKTDETAKTVNPNHPNQLDQLIGSFDKYKMNLLHLAADFGYAKVSEVLLKHGADPLVRGPEGSALAMAKKHSRTELVKLLEQNIKERKNPPSAIQPRTDEPGSLLAGNSSQSQDSQL